MQTPWGLKLLSGGTLYKNIGYYFYFYLSERGEVAGIEDAYIHFNNVFGSELDVMVGQFQTSDPLMKRELRLTFEDYIFYKTKIGQSLINLTYDRGIMFTYGIPQIGTDLAALIVNGNGKAPADEQKKFDNDKYKNVAFRVKQGLGDFINVGGYYYYGKEHLLGEDSPLITNEVNYWGPDVSLSLGPLEFTGQYLVRTDTQPDSAVKDIRSSGIIAELIFSPQRDRSRYFFILLYNKVNSDLKKNDYQTVTFNGTYLIARNLRIMAEFTRDFQFDKSRFAVGLVSAF